MKQITVNIPDNFVSSFMEYFSSIPDATIVPEPDFEIDVHKLTILDKSHDAPDDQYLTKDESNALLRKKYGL